MKCKLIITGNNLHFIILYLKTLICGAPNRHMFTSLCYAFVILTLFESALMIYIHALRILIIKGFLHYQRHTLWETMMSVFFGVLFIKGSKLVDLSRYSSFSRNDKYYFIVIQRERFVIFYTLFEWVDCA